MLSWEPFPLVYFRFPSICLKFLYDSICLRYAYSINCLEMLSRPLNRILCIHSIVSGRAGLNVELVGQRSDIALVSITDPSEGDIPHEVRFLCFHLLFSLDRLVYFFPLDGQLAMWRLLKVISSGIRETRMFRPMWSMHTNRTDFAWGRINPDCLSYQNSVDKTLIRFNC